MKRVFLIRHGETMANIKHQYCGSSDLSLSDEGKEKLKDLISLYDDVSKDSIFITSGMKRANESLNILFGDVKKEEYPGLKEMDFGPFELKTYEELKDDKDYQAWIQDTFNNKIKGGESFLIQRRRVLSAYDEIIQKYKNIDKDVIILAHGGTIFHIIDNLFKEGKYVYEIQPASGHAYVIDYTKEKISYEKR